MFDVIREIGAITRLIQTKSNAEFRGLGLGNNAFIYVIRACEQPGMFMGELADSVQIDRTTAFRTIKKMVAGGWFELRADATDQRLRRVYPTKKAKAVYPRLHAFEQAQSDYLLSGLTPNERTRLTALVKKLKVKEP
ncbi:MULTISPECIES: MarR family winged helix-turn-helix transcriptional regulator [unclassified Lacticaseibacillus]|uniref:MarR family winged helix-turn-helix transcriptional regulator n=1 Tax=unclassified Lacticaseibacillus TaxID=2759744 RepID=UPI001942C72E|nr:MULTISPECIES: MarR family transcriptional regulator [unclassified Lacticaseibacillus]